MTDEEMIVHLRNIGYSVKNHAPAYDPDYMYLVKTTMKSGKVQWSNRRTKEPRDSNYKSYTDAIKQEVLKIKVKDAEWERLQI